MTAYAIDSMVAAGPLRVANKRLEALLVARMRALLLMPAFGLVALAIDRRALLVSSLAYVLFALYALFRQAGAVELSWALTSLVIGSALLLLSALWHQARTLIVNGLPPSLTQHLPYLDRAAA